MMICLLGSGCASSVFHKLAKNCGKAFYDLDTDPKESNNLHSKHPEIVEQLTAVFRQFVENGRSTPGPKQANHHGTHWETIPWPKEK